MNGFILRVLLERRPLLGFILAPYPWDDSIRRDRTDDQD
jgi:hypothetical protein